MNTIAARILELDSVKSILFESELAAPLDVASYSILIRRAPDYATARAVLDEMKAAGLAPNVITSTAAASLVESRDQATELRIFFRDYRVAGTAFHSAVYTKLCKLLDAKELLDWAFCGGGGVPLGAFETAVAAYRRQGRTGDALRIASAFPYSNSCRKMFREENDKAFAYLLSRFENNEEPQNAAYALGIYHEEQGQISEALNWLIVARDHPRTSSAKKQFLQKAIEKSQLQLIISCT